MGNLVYASLSHIHYMYEVGMLKVPATHIEERLNEGSWIQWKKQKDQSETKNKNEINREKA